MSNSIQQFLNSSSFAVAGASQNPAKYGYKVFVALKSSGRQVYPLNPVATEIAGQPAFATLQDLPVQPEALSIITPPEVTKKVVDSAIAAGVHHIWMQPGAEEPSASKAARAAGINVIDDGSCILVSLSLEANKRKSTN
ncbi:MAG: CoA-binding protein [Pirellulales bacterium]